MRRTPWVLVLALSWWLAGCGGSGGASSPAPVAGAQPGSPVVRVEVLPGDSLLRIGETLRLQAVATWSDGTRRNVTGECAFAVLPGQVARVGPDGLLTVTGNGSAQVIATLEGVSGAAGLTVAGGSLVSLSVAPSTGEVITGGTLPFTATARFSDGQQADVTSLAGWTSSNPVVATVLNGSQAPGLAQGRAAGTAAIRASLGDLEAQGTLEVGPPEVTSVSVLPPFLTLQVGRTQQYLANSTWSDGVTRGSTAQVGWSSSASGVAAMTLTGLASGIAAGSASILATLEGVTGEAPLEVAEASLVALEVTPADATLATGSDAQYAATGVYDDGDTEDLTSEVAWSSSAPSVAAVSSGGLVTGGDPGPAAVTATLGAVSGDTGVTVSPAALVSIAVEPGEGDSIVTGLGRQFTATGTFSDGHTEDVTTVVSWASSNDGVAEASNTAGRQGRIEAVHNGTVDITALEGGLRTTVRIRVMLYLYATDGPFVYGFAIEPTGGGLVPVPATPRFGASLRHLAVDPSNRFLFALDGTLQQIFTCAIDGGDGSLTPRPAGLAAGRLPNAMAVSPDGRFLYVTDGADGVVRGFAIDDATGALTPLPASPGAGRSPNGLAFDPTGSFLYVTDFGGQALHGFSVDGPSGALAPLGPVATGAGPLGLAISSDGRFAWVANSAQASVSGYALAGDGAATPLAGSPFPVAGQPFGLVAGSAVWSLDLADPGIRALAVDTVSGALAPGPTFASGGTLPGALALEPGGRYLYGSFLADPLLAGFAVESPGGGLSSLIGLPVPGASPFEFVTTSH